MKLVEFTYTKVDGSVSDRAVLELVTPAKHMEGIDVSKMPVEDYAEFVVDFAQLKNAQHEATMKLLADYDLKTNYRRFLPDQMSDVKVEHI
jgi:hypothetical protein